MQARLPLVILGIALLARDTAATRDLSAYRYFRALSIDLTGRPPSRAELSEFEKPGFDLPTWIDAHLNTPAYAERIRRVYADLLRLDLPEGAVAWAPPPVMLRWTTIQGPDARPIDLYFREGQRRSLPALDGQVCFSPSEIGVQVPHDGPPIGTPRSVSNALLEARTVLVRPWWLYRDYTSSHPKDRAGPSWVERLGYELLWSLFVEPDGKTPMTQVRVCREEAQRATEGKVVKTGRVRRKGDPLPAGRLSYPPADTAFATANAGSMVSCTTAAGFASSTECGCGVGLERCIPTGPNGFMMPWSTPLGIEQPFSSSPRPASLWLRTWWAQEAIHFMDDVFLADRDVRELLTSPATMINGPLAQFYRFLADASCCGTGAEFGYNSPESLFDPHAVPASIAPHDVAAWTRITDRGPHASGLLTMPIFLLKYGSRRQRAHAVYRTFLCQEFVAENAELRPSTEPDLTRREGCRSCHRRLEPMAAFFARIEESDWTYLPPARFPVSNTTCAASSPTAMPPACRSFYDPDFTTSHHATLRGAHAAPSNVDAGPRGLATEITRSPAFASCVVRNVAQSLLGRPLTHEDDAWQAALAEAFVSAGYRMRSLVRTIVVSSRYRDANDLLRGGR